MIIKQQTKTLKPKPNNNSSDVISPNYKEIWCVVEESENKLAVSNLGRVKSLPRKYSPNEQIMKQSTNSYGYKTVTTTVKKKHTRFLVHRLVAKYFVKGDIKLQVNHKDGCKTNNNFTNLEWVTLQENVKHACKNDLRAKQLKGVNNQASKIIFEYDLNGNFISQYKGIRDVCKLLNIDRAGMNRHLRGLSKSIKGRIFKYENH